VRKSTLAALHKAHLSLADIDWLELWDASVIELVLSLESGGLLEAGKGWQSPPKPVNQSGGCLGRGNPVGASGMYQLVESVNRLQNEDAGRNALIQAVGGCGATAITHILSN
jgi:acetyl-CoA C-acetyltransferase